MEVEEDTGSKEEEEVDTVSVVDIAPTVHDLHQLDMVLDIRMAILRITKDNIMDHGVQFNIRDLKIMALGVQVVTKEMYIIMGMAVDTATMVPKESSNSGILMEAIKEEVISHPGDLDRLPLIETSHSDIYLLILQEMVTYYIILI